MQGSSRTGASRPRGHEGTWRLGFTTGPLSPATALLRPLLRGLSARPARGLLGGLLPCRLPSRGLLSGRLLSGHLLPRGFLCRLPLGGLLRRLFLGDLFRGLPRRLRRRRRLGLLRGRWCGSRCGGGERRPLHRKGIHPPGARPAHFHIMKVRHLSLPFQRVGGVTRRWS